jgi:hypothetical protein
MIVDRNVLWICFEKTGTAELSYHLRGEKNGREKIYKRSTNW